MHYKEYKTLLSPKGNMNIYRGCEHGCIYCDSRSLCYQINHDFEDIEVKTNAPEMLEAQLRARRKKCVVHTGAMSDPYIPLELELGYTRRCLEVIHKYGYGLAIQTKSDRILRDLDLIEAIHRRSKAVVQMTLTTFDEGLCKILEPNVCGTRARFEALCAFRDRGIPTAVWITPILPYINDTQENLRGILDYCIRAGVRGIITFGMGLTLRDGDREYFYRQLDAHFPGLKERYQRRYGLEYELPSDNQEPLMEILTQKCRDHGILCDPGEVFEWMHAFPEDAGGEEQMSFL